MKISKRDIKLLLMFLGIAFLAVSYFWVYKGQMDEAANIESQNLLLTERLNELLAMDQDKDFYKDETERMNLEVQNYVKSFPAAVKEEDGILLANRMEKVIDMRISNVSLGNRELLSTLDGSAEAEESAGNETLMEKGNSATQEQLDTIEGMEGSNDGGTRTNVPDDTGNAAAQAIYDQAWRPALYRNQDTFQFVTDYRGLKDAVKYINSEAGRMTVNSISASLDSSTGKLSGTVSVNLYSMSNTGSSYVSPDAGNVKLGTHNIFGTLEKPKKKVKKRKK